MNQKVYDIWLTLVEGVGPKTASLLLRKFGSAFDVYSASFEQLTEAGISISGAQTIILSRGELYERACFVEQLCQRSKIKVLTYFDQDYPSLLRETSDAPHVLYVRGSLDLNNHNFLSIVGTRQASGYGLEMCKRIVGEISSNIVSPVTVSGLALGIDKCAHIASLERNVPTVAVMAGWVDDIVPQSHYYIARQILEKGGAIISDMPPGTIIKGGNFLSRNRIIAGLSKATIVVESKLKGGSMVTADIAVSYNRDLFTPVGDGSESFDGNIALIKANKALVYQNIKDVIGELNLTCVERSKSNIDSLPKDLLESFFKLPDNTKFCLEEAVDFLDCSVAQASSTLSRLELSGLLNSLHGRMYIKNEYN